MSATMKLKNQFFTEIEAVHLLCAEIEKQCQTKDFFVDDWVVEPVAEIFSRRLGRSKKEQREYIRHFIIDALEGMIKSRALLKNGMGYCFKADDYQTFSQNIAEQQQCQLALPLENTVALWQEGAATETVVTTYERNPQARRDCLKIHGFDCAVCGFNFEQVWGEIGRNYIHVHHLEPLHRGERLTDAHVDLRPVCPNCHAMLHRRQPPFSIEELKRKKNL